MGIFSTHFLHRTRGRIPFDPGISGLSRAFYLPFPPLKPFERDFKLLASLLEGLFMAREEEAFGVGSACSDVSFVPFPEF